MSKRFALAFAALALAGTAGGTASAASGIGDPPIVKEIMDSAHRCGGHVDFACKDGSGAFCTVWLNSCYLGR